MKCQISTNLFRRHAEREMIERSQVTTRRAGRLQSLPRLALKSATPPARLPQRENHDLSSLPSHLRMHRWRS